MKKKKRLYYVLGGLLLVLIIAAIVKGDGDGKDFKVSTEVAMERNVIEVVAANGKIQPEIEVKISSDVSGEIIFLAVKDGDKVEEGDLLVKINPDIVESARNRAQSALDAAKANLLNAESRLAQIDAQYKVAKNNYDRNLKLYNEKVISDQEWDNIKSAFEGAEANKAASKHSVEASRHSVKSAEATLKEAQDNLGRTSIYAPMSGVVVKLNKEKGERVVGNQMMEGTEIMRVANLDIMEVHVDVNENDIVRVALGDTTEIEVDAYVDRTFKGLVTEIANSASSQGAMSTDQVTNFPVKIQMLRSSYADLIPKDRPHLSPFRPGMSATVEVQTERKQNVVTIPIQAVTTREDTSTSAKEWKNLLNTENGEEDDEIIECIFVHDGGKAVLRTVKTGIQDTKYIEIVEGVEEGDEIISGPYDLVSRRINNGDKVEVVDKEDLFSRDD
jgi:HlyD family secretion protein